MGLSVDLDSRTLCRTDCRTFLSEDAALCGVWGTPPRKGIQIFYAPIFIHYIFCIFDAAV